MRNSRLVQVGGVLVAAALAFTSMAQSPDETHQMPSFGETRPGKVPLKAGITNGEVTITWQLMPGKWELTEQKPAFTGDWKPIPADQYQTNGLAVSATLPLPKEGATYRVHRTLGLQIPKLPPNLPPIPPPPTNRPPHRPNQ